MNTGKKEIKTAEDSLAAGREFFNQGKFSEAREAFLQATQLDPQMSDAWNALASALCELNEGEWSDEAVEYLMLAIKTDSKNAKAWNNLADFYIRRGEYDQAVTYLEKNVELAPENPVAHGNLGIGYRNLKRFDDAIDCFSKAIALDNRCGWSTYQLGFTYLLRGTDSSEARDLERARDVFRYLKNNLSDMENQPTANEIRLIETYLTMKLTNESVMALLLTNVPEEVPYLWESEEQVSAFN